MTFLSSLRFLSLKDENLGVPGNTGLKDQLLALKWVKENSLSFGGDPNNITIFGESAGAASTHYMMLAENAKHLFHKAVLMSGCSLTPWAQVPPHNWAYRLAKLCGYTGSSNDYEVLLFLRKTKASELCKMEMKLLNADERKNRVLFPFGPVVEPYIMNDCIIPENPLVMMRKSWSNNIPVIIGGTSFEGLFSYPETKKHPHILKNLNNCEYLVPFELNLDREGDKCKEFGLRIKKAHFGNKQPSDDTKLEYCELLTYKYFWHGLHRAAMSRLEYATAPTYVYRFDFDSPHFNHIRVLWCGRKVRGTCHGDDLSYMFFNCLAEKLSSDSLEYLTIQRMIGFLTKFAYTANPNDEIFQAVEWKSLKKNERLKCLNISDEVKYMDLPENAKLEVWDSLYPKELLF